MWDLGICFHRIWWRKLKFVSGFLYHWWKLYVRLQKYLSSCVIESSLSSAENIFLLIAKSSNQWRCHVSLSISWCHVRRDLLQQLSESVYCILFLNRRSSLVICVYSWDCFMSCFHPILISAEKHWNARLSMLFFRSMFTYVSFTSIHNMFQRCIQVAWIIIVPTEYY